MINDAFPYHVHVRLQTKEKHAQRETLMLQHC